jgi:D-alanine-D-alanine ligase
MKKVGLFLGGLGNEAEVSIVSAQNVAANFDEKKYELVLIYWHRDGFFYKVKNFAQLENPKIKIAEADFAKTFDVALLMTHGRFGEDGILQGILEKVGVKYAGCRVLSSALCMDKAVCKNFLQGYDIVQSRFEVIDLNIFEKNEINQRIEKIKNSFKLPLFVKPSNSGSSVGITKVLHFDQLEKAIKKATLHDCKVVIEEGISDMREVEIGILGNSKLVISRPGELILAKEFYDYDEKYKNNKTEVKIPAQLNAKQEKDLRLMAEKIYRLCDCRGFARLDFFVAKNKIYFNEINTLPGFTKFSMYPMLMIDTGMSYKKLINRIIKLAL